MAYNPIGQGLAGLGQGIGASLQQRRQETRLRGLLERVQGDDPTAMAELASLDPSAAKVLLSQQQSAAEQQRLKQQMQMKEMGVIAEIALGIKDPVKRRAHLIRRMEQEQDPEIKAEIADALNMDDDALTYDLQEAVTQVRGLDKADPAAPSSVREYQYYQSLSPEEKREYLRTKRAGQYFDMNGVQMATDPVDDTARPVQMPGQPERTQAEINAELADQRGEEAAKVEAEKQSIRLSEEAYKSLANVKSSISNMDEAIAAIDEGASSGRVSSMLPSVRESSIKLDNIQKRMGLDVIGNTTFGALSGDELKFALDTALPKDLKPAELREWLIKKREAQQKLAAYLENAAAFLGRPGNTVADFLEMQRSESQDQRGDSDQPPMPGARQAADGNWYIQQNGQWFRVDN